MKKILVIGLALFGVIFLAGCGQRQTIVQQSPVDETASWETYSDAVHGFEFKYPKNDNSFVAFDGRSTGLIFSVEKDGVEALYGNFQHKTTITAPDCPKNMKNIGTITVGGISANKCLDTADTAGPAWNTVIQKKNSDGVDVYTISCSNEHSDFESYCEKLLSTFKFTLQNKTTSSGNFVFEDEGYSLTLPSDYKIEPGMDNGYINPKEAGSFPSIKLDLMGSKEKPSVEDILKNEKTFLAGLCSQTESCGEITKWEPVEIGGKTALKFTVHYKHGRSIDDSSGYINGYRYSVPHIKYEYDPLKYPQDQNKYPHTYILQFSVFANDLENPEQQGAILDSIMQTITFK